MKKTMIRLYWQQACAAEADAVSRALEEAFPALTFRAAAALEPAPEALDTSRGQYDAAWLLRQIPEPFAIWLIAEDITYAGYDFVYGAALDQKAVVSSARTGPGAVLNREACHELGHLLGLEHCEGPCLMSPSLPRAQNPAHLCPACTAALRVL